VGRLIQEWTVPQLSIMIIYNCTLSILIQLIIIENITESILSDCDKPYHKIKENIPHGKELENLWNYP